MQKKRDKGQGDKGHRATTIILRTLGPGQDHRKIEYAYGRIASDRGAVDGNAGGEDAGDGNTGGEPPCLPKPPKPRGPRKP